MAKNQLANNQDEQISISRFMTASNVRKRIIGMVGENNADTFISAVVSAVSTNPSLNVCTRESILSAALLGSSLRLSPSPQLGYYYMVPYKNQAQFQLGYKGYVQLAMRSGLYKNLDVIEVKQGELIRYSRFNGTSEFEEIQDEEERENAPTVGYYAYFELLNGFRKQLYWTMEKMEGHAIAYSQSYKNDKRYGNQNSFWSKDFDEMAKKTMLRQLLSKWGILSIDMQQGYVNDMASLDLNGEAEFVDNQPQGSSYQEPETPKKIEELNPDVKGNLTTESPGHNQETLADLVL